MKILSSLKILSSMAALIVMGLGATVSPSNAAEYTLKLEEKNTGKIYGTGLVHFDDPRLSDNRSRRATRHSFNNLRQSAFQLDFRMIYNDRNLVVINETAVGDLYVKLIGNELIGLDANNIKHNTQVPGSLRLWVDMDNVPRWAWQTSYFGTKDCPGKMLCSKEVVGGIVRVIKTD